eukprot:tig00001574_g9348.t1
MNDLPDVAPAWPWPWTSAPGVEDEVVQAVNRIANCVAFREAVRLNRGEILVAERYQQECFERAAQEREAAASASGAASSPKQRNSDAPARVRLTSRSLPAGQAGQALRHSSNPRPLAGSSAAAAAAAAVAAAAGVGAGASSSLAEGPGDDWEGMGVGPGRPRAGRVDLLLTRARHVPSAPSPPPGPLTPSSGAGQGMSVMGQAPPMLLLELGGRPPPLAVSGRTLGRAAAAVPASAPSSPSDAAARRVRGGFQRSSSVSGRGGPGREAAPPQERSRFAFPAGPLLPQGADDPVYRRALDLAWQQAETVKLEKRQRFEREAAAPPPPRPPPPPRLRPRRLLSRVGPRREAVAPGPRPALARPQHQRGPRPHR